MDQDSYVQLSSGNTMPNMGLGTWQLTSNTTEVINTALDLGYRMIDTSSDYKTQPAIGQALKMTPISRGELYIVTKVEETDNAYDRVKSNLKELQLNYIDLMLIHRPPPSGPGYDLWNGLINAKEEGLTKDIGVSNYSIDQIEQLIKQSGEIPVVNQIEWSPFGHSQKMSRYCQENNITIMAYSPLTRNQRLNDQTLNQIADEYNKSPAQVLIRWSLQSEAVPIPKASTKEHLTENLNVFDFEIDEVDMQKLNRLNSGFSSFNSPLPYI